MKVESGKREAGGWGGGFTLIELLVVMAIIATLLSIAVPRYFAHVEKAKETALKQTLATTRDAIDKFHGDTGRYPAKLDDLVSQHYLRRLPLDPLLERDDAWVINAPPPKSDPGAVYDLHSSAEGVSRDGERFSAW